MKGIVINYKKLLTNNVSGTRYYIGSTMQEVWSQISGTLSINEIENNEDVNIYPNPTTGIFTISTEGGKIKEVKVFNLLGEEIYSTTIDNQQTTINLSSQAQGIYFVQVEIDKGIMRKKLVRE